MNNRAEAAPRRLAFIVPSLGAAAAQDEAVVQLLLFAAARSEQLLAQQLPFSATIITAARDTAGWPHCAALFSEAALEQLSIQEVAEPATPNLAIAGHKPAYDLFEHLKQHDFHEVHCLDQGGLAYYPTQARQLGLHFLHTVFAVHIVGATLFHLEAADQLLDSLGALMDDMLERGCVERADLLYVHDRKAWQWYQGKITPPSPARVFDLAWPHAPGLDLNDSGGRQSAVGDAPADCRLAAPSGAGPTQPMPIIYYGALSAAGGLPLFCDTLARTLPAIKRPIEVHFVGPAQAVGGLDAVSYIHLRAAAWGVPITIKRDLALADELAYLAELGGVLCYNTVRRESLRARLAASMGLPHIHVGHMPGTPPADGQAALTALPSQLAQALLSALAVGEPSAAGSRQATEKLPTIDRRLPTTLWQAGRLPLPNHGDSAPAQPLQLPGPNQPKVSVCITHFSRPHKLRTALESLKRQTYQNFEVVVVDDGSPEPAVQAELARIHQEIEPLGWRVLRQENRYLGAARNFGARHTRGDYLIFMDDDNAAKPHEISTLVAVAQRSGADLVTSFYDSFESEADLAAPAPAMRFTPFGADATLGILTNCFGDANALYARAAFERVGGFTEDYGITHEDWEFFCRAVLAGLKLVCVPEPLFWYRIDQQGMYRGEQTQLHKGANLRRHIRPFLEQLPAYQARLVQLAQGLSAELPLVTVGPATRAGPAEALRARQAQLPYARAAIITRTKDRPLLLRRAIAGILAQTFRDWLLVIVNDGGDPAAVDLVVEEQRAALAGRVLVLHHPIALGMQTAANAGLSSCESDFLIIHDDDDSWEPGFLARTISHIDERAWNPRLGGVITWARVIVESIDDAGTITRHSDFIFDANLRTLSLVELAVENRFPPISFLFRRSALEAVGPFREQYGVLGDWDFHLRVLQQFDIDVIAEPLANYHHRTKDTAGVYGNSVHAQTDVHRAKRVQLINGMVRGQGEPDQALPLAQLMTLGELHHRQQAEQRREFQRLHDYIWTLEQRLSYVATQAEQLPGLAQAYAAQLAHALEARAAQPPAAALTPAPALAGATHRNLVRNGDFRVWPGVRSPRQDADRSYAYAELAPALYACYDGRHVVYRAERRMWLADGRQLPLGASFLHLEHEGQALDASWFVIEHHIPSARLLAGRQITISGLARLCAPHPYIRVGGRFDLGDGRTLAWPTEWIALDERFAAWSCTLTCPGILPGQLRRGHQARLLLWLPYGERFTFGLTNLQLEYGPTPSAYEHSPIAAHQLARMYWRRAKAWLRQPRALPMPADDALTTKPTI